MARGTDGVRSVVGKQRLVARLDEMDVLIRQEIAQELKCSSDFRSAWLACLLRARADIQSAITSLLGGSA